jgi:hypothetical protein
MEHMEILEYLTYNTYKSYFRQTNRPVDPATDCQRAFPAAVLRRGTIVGTGPNRPTYSVALRRAKKKSARFTKLNE